MEVFYHALEQIPYWFDRSFREKYSGGTSIETWPRVEKSLTNTFSKRQYYAIVYFVAQHWDSLGTTTTHRPHVLEHKDDKMMKEYYQQFHYQHWYELGFCLLAKWNGKPIGLKIQEAIDNVDEFKVLWDHFAARV